MQSGSKSRSTIRDIAEAAGVSPKTVSFVLNGKEGVSKETRARVLKTVSRLDYHPHAAARALRGRVSRTVGVTFTAPWNVSPLSRNLLFWLYEELVRVFGSRGFYVTFDMAPNAYNGRADYARGVWEQAFGSCILVGPLALDDRICRRLHETGVPYVVTGRLDGFPECSSATVDYERAAYLSTKYLLAKGHRKIGLVGTFEGYQPGLERKRGYRRALREAGVPVDSSLFHFAPLDVNGIAREIDGLLSDREVTALIDATGAEDAAVVREGVRHAGRRLEGDLEVVLWTYLYDTAILPEASAHVWLPTRPASAEGLAELAAWIEGERQGPIQILHQPVLFERTSQQQREQDWRLFNDAL